MKRSTMTRLVFCAINVAVLSTLSSLAYAEDTAREKVIRDKTLGYDAQERAIAQDQQNRQDNAHPDSNAFGNGLNVLNKIGDRNQQRENAAAQRRDNELGKLKADYDKISKSFAGDIEIRKPLPADNPNAGDQAWVVLEYCMKNWADDKYREKQFPCDLAKQKFLLGINGRGVYEPNPAKAVDTLEDMLKEDLKHQAKFPADTQWQSYAPEIAYYLGQAYFLGLDFPNSKIKQDYAKAKTYFEQSISYASGMRTSHDQYKGLANTVNVFSKEYLLASYYRLIEMYDTGLGVPKDAARAQALAKDIGERTDALNMAQERTFLPDWPKVEGLVMQYAKAPVAVAYTSDPAITGTVTASKNFPVMVAIPGRNYEIGKYEVTQAEWVAVMGSIPDDIFPKGDTLPFAHASSHTIKKFLDKLNQISGKKYRLPTEEEWLYACYGGQKTEYCGGNDANAVGWYSENSTTNGGAWDSHPVGRKQANGYGLYDMSGNLSEEAAGCTDTNCDERVLLGGNYGDSDIGATTRYTDLSTYEDDPRMGFRLARTLP